MSSNTLPLVWIVVLNWNLLEVTKDCILSLRNLSYPVFRILIVDNGSTDNSVEELKTLEDVTLLVNEKNVGFAAGNNRGIEYALRKGADYVLILNNDVVVAPDMLSKLVSVAQSDSNVGVVGPVIYYSDAPKEVWFAGMRFRDRLYVVRRGLHLERPLDPVERVDFISGCGMLVKREVWEQVGLFDERFFMYYEDLDFALRVKKAGYSLVCSTETKMWHMLSASTGGHESPLKQYYQVKSMLLFCKKHTRGLMRFVNIGIRLFHAGFVALRNFLQGRFNRKTIVLYVSGIVESMKNDNL
jgi:hypothetical protein